MPEVTKTPPSLRDARPTAAEAIPSAPRVRERGASKTKASAGSSLDVEIERVCREVVTLRKRPLLVLYYPRPDGSMEEDDVEYCYRAFREGGVSPDHRLKECDILLHTAGGSPVAGYRLAQCIRDFADDV